MNDLITKENEQVNHFFKSIESMLSSIEDLIANSNPHLDGEYYFTDKEVSEHLKVSRRTLQDWRNNGRIAYIALGGKTLYRASDIEKMLQDNYCSAF